VAVITNGSLLYRPEVRAALADADVVLPTLDAGSRRLYRRVNRPHSEATFDRLVEGLIAFRSRYHGKLWVEVMLVKGLNDSEEALQDLADVLLYVQPDAIHVMRPERLPAEAWVEPADDVAATKALALLGRVAPVLLPESVGFEVAGGDVLADAICAVLARHPAREEELRRWLRRCVPGREGAVMAMVQASGQVQVVERYGVRFWSIPGAYYAPPRSGQS
jgi:wyosine [tRNA(Phe)-imidazoG37] synthetase (radical SAM superfamily)